MNRKETLRNLSLAGAVVLTGGIVSSEAQAASTPSKTITCGAADKWYELQKGEVVLLKTSGAVGTIDASVDGVVQYDNDANTSTVLGFKSSNNSIKSWVVKADYPGAINVLKCSADFGYTDARIGGQARKLDASLGKNNATKRVNLQYLSK